MIYTDKQIAELAVELYREPFMQEFWDFIEAKIEGEDDTHKRASLRYLYDCHVKPLILNGLVSYEILLCGLEHKRVSKIFKIKGFVEAVLDDGNA